MRERYSKRVQSIYMIALVGLATCSFAIQVLAGGKIICFISGNCVAPYDWLFNFYLAYQKYPDVAGIGGYIKKFIQRNFQVF